MLTRHSSRLRGLQRASLTALSVLMIAVGLTAFRMVPAPRAATQNGYTQVTFAASSVSKADPRLSRLAYLHRWHELHKQHMAYLNAKARAAALAAYAAAHPHTVITHAAAPLTVTVHASGPLTTAQVEALWEQAGGPAWAAPKAAEIAWCESSYNPRAYNPSGATGIWQILGSVVPGDLTSPYVNALNAVAKFRASGDTFSAWVCQ